MQTLIQFLEIHSLIVGRYFWIILECIIGCFCIEKCMAVYGNYMFNRQLTVNGEPMYPLCNSLLYILSIRDKKVLMALYMSFNGE